LVLVSTFTKYISF